MAYSYLQTQLDRERLLEWERVHNRTQKEINERYEARMADIAASTRRSSTSSSTDWSSFSFASSPAPSPSTYSSAIPYTPPAPLTPEEKAAMRARLAAEAARKAARNKKIMDAFLMAGSIALSLALIAATPLIYPVRKLNAFIAHKILGPAYKSKLSLRDYIKRTRSITDKLEWGEIGLLAAVLGIAFIPGVAPIAGGIALLGGIGGAVGLSIVGITKGIDYVITKIEQALNPKAISNPRPVKQPNHALRLTLTLGASAAFAAAVGVLSPKPAAPAVFLPETIPMRMVDPDLPAPAYFIVSDSTPLKASPSDASDTYGTLQGRACVIEWPGDTLRGEWMNVSIVTKDMKTFSGFVKRSAVQKPQQPLQGCSVTIQP